jgi:four helix bundle protein
MGSLSEVDYQLLLSRDLAYIGVPEYDRLSAQLQEVRRMLIAYILKIKQNSKDKPDDNSNC